MYKLFIYLYKLAVLTPTLSLLLDYILNKFFEFENPGTAVLIE